MRNTKISAIKNTVAPLGEFLSWYALLFLYDINRALMNASELGISEPDPDYSLIYGRGNFPLRGDFFLYALPLPCTMPFKMLVSCLSSR